MARPKLLMLLHCLNEQTPLILQWAVRLLLASYKGKGLWICKRFPLHCSRQNLTLLKPSVCNSALLLWLHSMWPMVLTGHTQSGLGGDLWQPHKVNMAQGTLSMKWWGNKHPKTLLQGILATEELNSIDPRIKIMLASFTLARGCYFFFTFTLKAY